MDDPLADGRTRPAPRQRRQRSRPPRPAAVAPRRADREFRPPSARGRGRGILSARRRRRPHDVRVAPVGRSPAPPAGTAAPHLRGGECGPAGYHLPGRPTRSACAVPGAVDDPDGPATQLPEDLIARPPRGRFAGVVAVARPSRGLPSGPGVNTCCRSRSMNVSASAAAPAGIISRQGGPERGAGARPGVCWGRGRAASPGRQGSS